MRICLLPALTVFAATAFASDPVFDIREMEDQFTQSTQDAQVIEQACAQSRTDRKACYQRAATFTAQCREQLKQQYFDTRSLSATVDREALATDLKSCVLNQSK